VTGLVGVKVGALVKGVGVGRGEITSCTVGVEASGVTVLGGDVGEKMRVGSRGEVGVENATAVEPAGRAVNQTPKPMINKAIPAKIKI
jgi:hypothetical protein